jgi:hypothetical protein
MKTNSFRLLSIALIALGLCVPDAATAQTFSGHTGRARAWDGPTAPQSTYSIDDGTAENGVGLTSGGSFIAVNEFPVIAGSNIINSISIAFGTPAFPEPTLNGLAYTAAIWSDPNGDGSPTDAVLLASQAGVISGASTNTFDISLITPTVVLTPNFFVGFEITHVAGQHPAGFDQTAPTFAGRSWITVGSNLNDLSGSITIESAGLVGNWLIRADTVPEPQSWAMLAFGAMMLVGVRRFFRKSA